MSSILPEVSDNAKQLYIRRYLDVFTTRALKGKTILLYQHSAVGRDILAQILESLGAKVIAVKRSNKFVPIDTENVTPAQLKFLKDIASKYKEIFAIISTDGDSDRPLIIDEQGKFHRGDILGILVTQYLKANFAAVPVSANDEE